MNCRSGNDSTVDQTLRRRIRKGARCNCIEPRKCPGSSESQGGGGLELLPGAIGCLVRHASSFMSSCLQGNYDDLQNRSRSVIITCVVAVAHVADCFSSKNTALNRRRASDRQILPGRSRQEFTNFFSEIMSSTEGQKQLWSCRCNDVVLKGLQRTDGIELVQRSAAKTP